MAYDLSNIFSPILICFPKLENYFLNVSIYQQLQFFSGFGKLVETVLWQLYLM